MLLRAIVIDDELLARQELEYLLQATGEVEVVAVGSNGLEAVDLIARHQPQVVFLDVQMPGLDGFGVIKRLLELKQPMPQVVFATAYDRYAVRAFEVNAVDYLLKPFSRSRVSQTVTKTKAGLQSAGSPVAPDEPSLVPAALTDSKLDALLRLVEGASQVPRRGGKLVVRANNRLLLVDQREICFASIEEGTISVVTPTLEGQSNCRTLEELMDLLDPEAFWRAHRSYVVNIQHIREVVPWFKSSYQLRMDDPKRTEIPVARTQTKRLRELFNL